MTGHMARADRPSLRFGRLESRRLIIALLLSLCVHFLGWGGYEYGKKSGWWERLHALTLWRLAHKPTPQVAKKEQPEQQPTVYVDVSQADLEPPKDTKYISDKNSHAANPDADKEANQPKLDGKQTDMLRMEDVLKPMKLQPSAPQPPVPPDKSDEQTPKSSPSNLGDQTLAKAENSQQPPEDAAPKRPRTLKEARAQQRQTQLPGRQTRQDGGVRRHQLIPSFDTRATPFGEYDRAIIEAVQQYWQDELDRNQFAADRTGQVTVKFDLHYDGSVDHVEIIQNNVGVLLGSFCAEAIQQTAPYGKWPSDMLHEIGETKFTVTFTFDYILY
jgi:outer membrane biosynthesis protein TonB